MRSLLVKSLSLLAIVSILLAACTRTTPTPPPATQIPASATPPITATITPIPPTNTPAPTATLSAAQFIGSACQFKLPAGLSEGRNLRCGYLSVPANRKDPNAGTLQLAVAVISPQDGATQPDPIVYLEGGPGGSSLEFLYLVFERYFDPMLATGRQIVLFDQRGVGLSRPALDCPEQDRLFLELLDNEMNGQTLTEEEMDELNIQAMETCAANLRTRADLEAFNTDENAADVADLAKALGFEQVNLWGVSYGTRLGLEVLRDYPELVRGAVLDSNVPPDANLYGEQPANLGRVFTLLFESCAADTACNAAYPDLREVFFDTVEKLNEAPASFNALDPLAGTAHTVAVSGDNLIDLVFQFIYDTEVLPLIPRLITNASEGNFDLLAMLVGSFIATQGAISDGMHFALQCQEEIPFTTPEEIAEAAEELPEFEDYFDEGSINASFATCDAMEIEQTGENTVNEAVSSDIPALVLAGEYDPVTPPAWAEQVAATLENSYLYEFPGMGHGVSLQPGCPQEITAAFFEDPSQKPDAECIDDLGAPAWVVPTGGDVEMEAFSIEAMGIEGRRPAGWQEVNTGVFSRQNSALDLTLVQVSVSPGTADNLLAGLTRQFGLQSPPPSTGEREANRLTWRLYSVVVRNTPIDVALTQSGDMAIMVLLQSPTDEHDALVENVFFPVIDSVRPIN